MSDPVGRTIAGIDSDAETDRLPRPWAIAVTFIGLALAIGVRVVLLPVAGFRGDTDQFALWVHDLTTTPLGEAYRENLSFPPVMVYVFAVLAWLEPAFRVATDAADTTVGIALKLPATLADFGLAAAAAWSLRRHPRWAIAAALALLLHPAVLDVSAWWGQFESIYVLAGFVAMLLAVADRPYLSAIALAVALMTKPQAIPFAIPLAAWFLGRYGLARSIRIAAVGGAAIVVIWLPFLPDGGPGRYLSNLETYQNDIFSVLSLRAWNPWWLLQQTGGATFLSDRDALLGPLSPRVLGLAMTGIVELVVFLVVLRQPTPRTLALALAASVLVSFAFLTTMHERYAFGALAFLVPLLPDRRVLAVWVAFGVAFTLNLLAAIPPTQEIRDALPIFGPLGVIGSLTLFSAALACLWLLFVEAAHEARTRTSAGSAAAMPAT